MDKNEVKINWATLHDRNFWSALNNIMSQKFDFKTGLKIINIRKKCESEMKKLQEMMNALRDRFYAKDDKGAFVVEDNKLVLKDGVTQDEISASESEMGMTDFKIKVSPLKIDDLAKVQLSASEIMALAPILEDVSVEEEQLPLSPTNSSESPEAVAGVPV